MQFGDQEIHAVTGFIWESVLGLQVDPTDRSDDDAGSALAGAVHIGGAWEGAVVLSCPEPFARRAAATMFSLDEPEVQSADVTDALGELANMVAGNIKGLLPEPCVLSLPTVARDAVFASGLRDVIPVSRVDFLCHGQRVRVTVLERDRREPGERREFPRAAVEAHAVVQSDTATVDGAVVDLGVGGLAIRSDDRLPEGVTVTTTVRLMDGKPPIAARGRVIRSSETGLVVKFDHLLGPDAFRRLHAVAGAH